jgi:hypothetical protein
MRLAMSDDLRIHDAGLLKLSKHPKLYRDEQQAMIELIHLRAEVLSLHEKVAFLESREVCGAAHENVDTCGYCQRDQILAEIQAALV